MLIEIFYLKIVFANNRFLNCASRTGFYTPHTLANFQSLTKFYPSVRAAQAFMRPTLWQTFRVCQS
ncbi:hypothetical protein HMPREF9075_01931 [Capnocytophaga sp. oral taxon 332 str. F0381]|nr:hypothetical protein HMPREF9075_01931 [Capnocytophaga sp. oral taxon 332 str. F0381]